MSYNNYHLEKNKCKCCWMERERPELKRKLNIMGSEWKMDEVDMKKYKIDIDEFRKKFPEIDGKIEEIHLMEFDGEIRRQHLSIIVTL